MTCYCCCCCCCEQQLENCCSTSLCSKRECSQLLSLISSFEVLKDAQRKDQDDECCDGWSLNKENPKNSNINQNLWFQNFAFTLTRKNKTFSVLFISGGGEYLDT